MLFVLFQVGPERCALEAQRVVEIIPLVALKKSPHSPTGVAGIFLYRGRPVPALDLCELSLGRPAADHFSTRIIIVNYLDRNRAEHLVGIIAERVTETLEQDQKQLAPKTAANTPFLGPVLTDAHGVIQLLSPEQLVQDSLPGQLFPPKLEAGHAPD